MRISWSPAAREDVRAAGRYVEQHDPAAAGRLVRRLTGTAPTIASHPEIGRTGRVEGTREFVVTGTSYIVVYRLSPGRVEIARVLPRLAAGPIPSNLRDS